MNPEQLAAQLRCPHDDDGLKVASSMDQRNAEVIEAAYAALDCRAGQRVLEIGPGGGGHVATLLRDRPGLDYTGLDLSPLMVREARAANHDWVEKGRARFLLGDLLAPPLADGGMDRIVAVNVVYFWQPLAPALERIHALLAPGGRCALGLRSRASMRELPVFKHGFALYDGPDLVAALEAAGFHSVRLEQAREETVNVLGQMMDKERLVVVGDKAETSE